MPTSGYLLPLTVASDATTGTNAWANTDNVKLNNTACASAFVGGNVTPTEVGAQLIRNGSRVGNILPVTFDAAGTLLESTYGGTSNLWGLTSLAASSVNASGFGVEYMARGIGGPTQGLLATNFNFSIPDGSTIDGVEVIIDRGYHGAYPVWVDIDYIGIRLTYTEGSDATNPVITITSPTTGTTYATASSSITLSGTATDAVGVTGISCSSGSTAFVSGTSATWTVSGITLNSGSNPLTVYAYDAAGNSSSDLLTVTYTPPDTEVPLINISSPTTGSTYSTASSSITISGSASDNIAVTGFTWTSMTSGGSTNSATGLNAAFLIYDIPLVSGVNNLVVTAYDAVGNTNYAQLDVTYTPITPQHGWKGIWGNILRFFGKGIAGAPTVSITSTGGNTTVGVVTIIGTSTNAVQITVNGVVASGTNNWSKEISLVAGVNVITVNAFNEDNLVSSAYTSYNYYSDFSYTITASGYWEPSAQGAFIRPYGANEFSPWHRKGMYTPRTFAGVNLGMGQRYKTGGTSFSSLWGIQASGSTVSIDIELPPGSIVIPEAGECHPTDTGWTCNVPPGTEIIITPPPVITGEVVIPSIPIVIPQYVPEEPPGVDPPYVPEVPPVIVPPVPPETPPLTGGIVDPPISSWTATGSSYIWDVNALQSLLRLNNPWVNSATDVFWINSWAQFTGALTIDRLGSANVNTTGPYMSSFRYGETNAAGNYMLNWSLDVNGKTWRYVPYISSPYNINLYDQIAGISTNTYPTGTSIIFRKKTLLGEDAVTKFFNDYNTGFVPRIVGKTDIATDDWLTRPTALACDYRVYTAADFEFVWTSPVYNYALGKLVYADFDDLASAQAYLAGL